MKPILSRRTRVSPSSVERGERLAVDFDFAFGGAVEAADQVQQRRFAGAGRADDGHHFAAGDVEIQALQRRHLTLARKLFGDAAEMDHYFYDDALR